MFMRKKKEKEYKIVWLRIIIFNIENNYNRNTFINKPIKLKHYCFFVRIC